MAGRSVLRWLAPISSTALLAYLVLRVSGCDHASTAGSTPQSQSEPQVSVAVGDERPAPVAEPASNAVAPNPTDSPEYFQRTNSLQFLGATKAAPMVIGDSLSEQAAREPPASEPAVEQGEP